MLTLRHVTLRYVRVENRSEGCEILRDKWEIALNERRPHSTAKIRLVQRCGHLSNSRAVVENWQQINAAFWVQHIGRCFMKCIDHALSSNRQHLSYDVCLEVRGEIIRTVLCCIVYWSCAVISTLRWAVLTVLWIGFCLTGPISLCIDLFVFICVYFVCFRFILHTCCIIVTR